MNKRTSTFLILALVSSLICILSLRANNQHMLKLRTAVYSADQQGSDVQTALNKLQAYVTTHMNTNLSTGTSVYPPIQLKYTYERLVQAQKDQFAKQNNDQLYTEAQHYCEQQNSVDFSGHNRVPCIEQYVQSHGGTVAPSNITIPTGLYEFAFASPSWSPDPAGWSLIVAIISTVLFVISLVADKFWPKLKAWLG